MHSASALRVQIEHSLERRFPSALTPQPRTIRETAPTGIPQVDQLLHGGLPVGAISELIGPESSGRTSLALAFLAGLTREDRVCAWVDASDAMDVESAAASGVNLRQLLWVRCRCERPTDAGETMGASGPGPSGNRSAAAGRRLLCPGAGPWFNSSRARLPYSAGNVVPLPPGCGPHALFPAGLAQQPLAQSSAAVVLECAPLAL